MQRHPIMPIDRLVDLLHKPTMVRLAERAPREDLSQREYTEGDAIPIAARKLLQVWDDPQELEHLFGRLARGYIRQGKPAIRHRDASTLARVFGAEPERLIRWMKYKYPWFSCRKAVGA
jgi:hypothetical protein